MEPLESGWAATACFAAAILGFLAVLALAGCAILPSGEPVSLAAVGVSVDDGAAGFWTDGATWVAVGPEARVELWSKVPELWTPPAEWTATVEQALIDGKRVVGRVYPWEVHVLEDGEELPEWARWVLTRWEADAT